MTDLAAPVGPAPGLVETKPPMAATAANLRDLHALHQRAKALRDRLSSGPKTLAARQATLQARLQAVADGRKALQDAKAKQKNREVQVQSMQGRIDDLRVKLNAVKKNEEYKAIQNQIANDKAAVSKAEDEILEMMSAVERQAADLAQLESEVKAYNAEVEALKNQIESQADAQRAQLKELETAIVEAESVIPEDERERYRRTVKQRAADALASVEGGACTGCFVAVTAQMVNHLITGDQMVFCKTCGRILYLAEDEAGR